MNEPKKKKDWIYFVPFSPMTYNRKALYLASILTNEINNCCCVIVNSTLFWRGFVNSGLLFPLAVKGAGKELNVGFGRLRGFVNPGARSRLGMGTAVARERLTGCRAGMLRGAMTGAMVNGGSGLEPSWAFFRESVWVPIWVPDWVSDWVLAWVPVFDSESVWVPIWCWVMT